MITHYSIKNGTQVYHIESGLTIGAAFDFSSEAKRFIENIPPECDIPDIQDNASAREELRLYRVNFPKSQRVTWENREYTCVSGAIMPSATYRGLLEEITTQYGIVKLHHLTSNSWEKEKGWHNYTLCVHILTGYTIGIGDNRSMKDQIKLWTKERFMHKGDGLFVSDANPRFKTQSHGKVTLE